MPWSHTYTSGATRMPQRNSTGLDFATYTYSSDGRRFASQVALQGLVAGATGGLVLCVGFLFKMSEIPLDFFMSSGV